MPGSKTVEHRSHKIVFSEDDHSYIDENGSRYVSVTTLVASRI